MGVRPSIRFEVFKRDEFTCRYCGRRSPDAILEVDHVIPRSAGGPDEIENLVTSCSQCNLGKGARPLLAIPDELNLHDRAALIAEQERQIAEYRHWKEKQRQREDDELERLLLRWKMGWRGEEWRESSARAFLRRLGYHDLDELIERMAEDERWGERSERDAWKYFCAACWKKIGALPETPGQ